MAPARQFAREGELLRGELRQEVRRGAVDDTVDPWSSTESWFLTARKDQQHYEVQGIYLQLQHTGTAKIGTAKNGAAGRCPNSYLHELR